MSKVIEFLRGNGVDGAGRKIGTVLNFSFDETENVHDYIQWLFPSDMPSECCPDAPVLSPDDIAIMKTDETIRANLTRAWNKMMGFYGSSIHWITPWNHNYLRITRILRCLGLAGMDGDKDKFIDFLLLKYYEYQPIIGDTTFHYWVNANNL